MTGVHRGAQTRHTYLYQLTRDCVGFDVWFNSGRCDYMYVAGLASLIFYCTRLTDFVPVRVCCFFLDIGETLAADAIVVCLCRNC